MLQKGSEQYKQAQKLANEIKDMAGTDRWNNNSYSTSHSTLWDSSSVKYRRRTASLLR